MKPKKIAVVHGPDGNALYVDGELVSDWFTVGHAGILKACGVKFKSHKISRCLHEHWPFKLEDAVKIQ